MAKATSPFSGRWRIVSMVEFDEEFINDEVQAFIEFNSTDGGQFQFGCFRGDMACRLTARDGEVAVEWSWEGYDEMDPEAGSGWAVLKGNDLHGLIGFNDGDGSSFVATRIPQPKARKRK
jgi:hypothetical protein